MVLDAHTHLFSRFFFSELVKQKLGHTPSEEELKQNLEPLGLRVPPADPEEHAAIWIKEMERHNIDRMVVFTSVPGEQTAVAKAVAAYPERLVGFTMVNPKEPDAAQIARRDLTELGLKGIELFPAMHGYLPSDEKIVYPILELADELNVPIFSHVGILRVPLREKLGLKSYFDMTFGDPSLLHKPAADFPNLQFIIPHFGAGYLREAVILGHHCDNVSVDTSSSNSWFRLMPERVTLARALEVCLEGFGPDRVIFGSDSSAFPRGYRDDILASLRGAFDDLELEESTREKILGGNMSALLNPNRTN